MAFLKGLQARTRIHSILETASLRILTVLLMAFLLSLGEINFAEAQDNREYAIKAAFLFNFIQFVKWPAKSFKTDESSFKIGILGDDPFGSTLDDTIRGESVGGRPVVVIREHDMARLSDCQIIFICRSEQDHLNEILSQVHSKPILTVSEMDGFAQQGGDINFYPVSGKIHFEINPQATSQAGLNMSSQLLALAKIINP
jgi:hypothetical protein